MSLSGLVNPDPLSTSDGRDSARPSARKKTAALEPGEQLGRYVVLYRLGTGGMGVVYAAYDPQLDRKVALKLLRHGSSSPERSQRAAERLMREARSMAQITHPNVITVHDATVVGSRVFLAMEHVDGVTLTRHLASGEHDWRDILKVLIAAGRGLAAAHNGGLVHRDFKPDNVMLARDGRVLVMDFGLARALQPDDDEPIGSGRATPDDEEDSYVLGPSTKRGKARASRVAGTPGYMAPEQHRAEATDSRTDQFSYCVTLYEALYRQRPFRGETAEQVAEQVAAAQIKAPPSTYHVPGWVRAALLRGLQPDPNDRWDSMDQLLDALEADPAVHRRRWFAVLSGAAVATAFGAATVWWVGGASACEPAEERLAGVWDDARRSDITTAFNAVDRPYAADALEGTTEGFDLYASSWLSMHQEVCEANRVRGEQSDALFDLRMECLDRRRSEFRALSDLFSEADVSVVKEAVVATSKLTPLAACANTQLLKTTVPLPHDPKVREQVRSVRDQLARAKAYEDGARLERSLKLIQTILETARTLDYPPVLAEAQYRHGTTLLAKGDPRGALAALRKSVQTASGSRHDEIAARASISLATALSVSGQVERSAEAAEAAAAAVERAGASADLVALLANLQGRVAFALGDYEAAEVAFDRALSMQREAFGDEHSSLARFYNNLALAHGQQGNLAESIAFLRRALKLEERVLGSVHPRVALITSNLGAVELRRGNLEVGEALMRRSIEISRSAVRDEPRLGMMINNLGEIRLLSLDAEGAKAEFLKAIEYQQRVLGAHPDLALTLANLGAAHSHAGEAEEALRVLDRGAAVLSETSGLEHPMYSVVLIARGEAELQLERYDAALEHFSQATEHLLKTPGMTTPEELGRARFGLAQALGAVEREPARARDLARLAHTDIASLPPVPLRLQWLESIAKWQAAHPAPLAGDPKPAPVENRGPDDNGRLSNP